MAKAERILNIARKEIGTEEQPANSNNVKYSKWYGMPGQPWCAMFVSWVLDQAGIDGYKHAYTPAGADLFRSQGRWTSQPQKGAVAYFDFPDSLSRIQHVGFVEKVEGDTVVCIEGNTSVTNNDNGGNVMRRERPRGWIVGYGIPPYEDAASGPKGSGEGKDQFGRGTIGGDVKMWQRHLNVVMDLALDQDGDFGHKTEEATKEFQRKYGFDVDGIVRPKMLKKMEDLVLEAKKEKEERPPVLTQWDEGKWVKEAKERLELHGYKVQGDKGDEFGEGMAAALHQFKIDHLPATTVLGRRLWDELLEDPKK